MIYRLYQLLWRLKNYDFIPKLPRGMLATDYAEEDVTRDEWRVMDRIGSRDRHGIKRAMRQRDVTSIDALIQQLEHHQPKHRVGHRFRLVMGRLIGGCDYHPHQAEINRQWKQLIENRKYVEIRERVKHARRHYVE